MATPRTIWAYWERGRPSSFSKLCMLTWKKLNPHWTIHLLNKSNYQEFVPRSELPNRFEELTSRLASDCLRLALLARHGGVWMDVSILLRQPLDHWCWNRIAPRSAFVFHHSLYDVQPRDFVESWFLAANSPQQDVFVAWRDRMCELLHDQVSAVGLAATHPLYKREYLAIHAMFKTLSDDPLLRAQIEGWQFEDAHKTALTLDVKTMLEPPEKSFEKFENIPLFKFTSPMQPNDLSPEFFMRPNTLIGKLFVDTYLR
eukprot:GEMP01028095.1.p1 GENE.GEMP01028095.1~~GEMP01028095.1.p1  ORF type:complete len:268 (+),score=41.37 GEMP01028095.1:32-805(+)